MSVLVFIDYRFINDTEWHTIEMSPEDYFDLDPDEKIEWNCVPDYDKEIDYLINYLNVDPKLVLNTRSRILDDEANISTVVTTTFWNQGENQISERFIKGLGVPDWLPDWLMVITIKIQDNPDVWEIMRLQRENDVPVLEFHSFITENEDGFQSEKIIYPITAD
jgi:hypothetical protein